MSASRSAALAAILVSLSMTAATPSARAQGATPESPQPAAPSLNITVEQQHVIKEIVLKDINVPKTDAAAPMQVGAVVPAAVTLHPFPDDVTLKVPAMKSHWYFVKDGKLVVVEQKDRKVVAVIE